MICKISVITDSLCAGSEGESYALPLFVQSHTLPHKYVIIKGSYKWLMGSWCFSLSCKIFMSAFFAVTGDVSHTLQLFVSLHILPQKYVITKGSGKMFFSRVKFVYWLLFGVRSTPVLPQWYVKDPGHSAKSTGGSLHPWHAYTLDPAKSEWADYTAVQV